MSVSQGRFSNRGPLIAVIKIEIEEGNTDRIFLHQFQDDYQLAEEFTRKHHLNASIVPHIHQRIRISRHTVQSKRQEQSQKNQTNSSQDLQLKEDIRLLLERTKQYPDLFSSAAKQDNHKVQYITPYQQSQESSKQLVGNQFKHSERQSRWGSKRSDSVNNSYGSEKRRIFCMNPNSKKQIYRFQAAAKQSVTSKKQQPKRCQSVVRISQDKPYLQGTFNVQSLKDAWQGIPRRVPRVLLKQQLQLLKKHDCKKSLSRKEIRVINEEVTARLYNESVRKKHYLEIIREKAKKQAKHRQDVELTYRPEINPISVAIAEHRHQNTPLEDYLLEEGKKHQFKMQAQMAKKAVKEVQNCSFHPSINQISQKLASERSVCSEQRSSKTQIIQEKLFKPILNKLSEAIMKEKNVSFADRQREYLENKNYRMIEKVKEMREKENIDMESKQELFKPKITQRTRSPQGNNIGNYLYNLKPQRNIVVDQKKLKINAQSQYLVQNLHFKKITQIFRELDSDNDGVISSHQIEINKIGADIINIIKPILFEMEQLNTSLNFKQFRDAMEILIKKLDSNSKSILFHKRKIDVQTY